MPESYSIIWTDYLLYRARIRGFNLFEIERILRYSTERYFDADSGRHIAVGRHLDNLVLIPYDIDDKEICPITIHATSRKQINFRLKTGRFIHET